MIPYNWTTNINRRVYQESVISNNRNNCPTGSWTATDAACVVMFGYVSQAANPSGTSRFIAAVAIDPDEFGDVGGTILFLEDFGNLYPQGGGRCTHESRGVFTYPTYRIQGNYYNSPSIVAGDIPTSCGRAYMTSLSTTDIRLTN